MGTMSGDVDDRVRSSLRAGEAGETGSRSGDAAGVGDTARGNAGFEEGKAVGTVDDMAVEAEGDDDASMMGVDTAEEGWWEREG